jgi:hypothetical protein
MKTLIASLALIAFIPNAHAVKNMTSVISGRLYISGNSGGRGPLSQSDLISLCNQGFTYAVYVYTGGVNKTVTCGGGRTLKYQNSTNWKNPSGILSQASAAISNGGKALIHCWNGVHASRFAGAVALTRFCGFNGPEAARWWRSGFSSASLPGPAVNELYGRLSRMPQGRGGMSGCPSPR